jgi:hypothetical protein
MFRLSTITPNVWHPSVQHQNFGRISWGLASTIHQKSRQQRLSHFTSQQEGQISLRPAYIKVEKFLSLSWHYTINSELKLAVMDSERSMSGKKCCTEGPAAQRGTLRYPLFEVGSDLSPSSPQNETGSRHPRLAQFMTNSK